MPWKMTSFLLPKPCCRQRHRNTTAAVSSWEKERRALLPSPPLTAPTLSPLCPATHRPVYLFGASLRPIQLQSHVSDCILIYKPIYKDFSSGKKKLSSLRNGMWFLWATIWPQVTSSAKVVPLHGALWVSPGHSLFALALPRMSVLFISQPSILVSSPKLQRSKQDLTANVLCSCN